MKVVIKFIRGLPGVIILAAVLLAASGCSTVSSSYITTGYSDDPSGMVKRVVVVINVPDDSKGIAPLVKDIVYDILTLRTNYLIEDIRIVKGDWKDNCKDKVTGGIILFNVEKYGLKGQKIVEIKMSCELYNCSNFNILWKAKGDATKKSDDEDLKEFTGFYSDKYPDTAQLYAAPVFIIIQDFVDIIPNPELTSEEIEDKIRLESQREDM